MYRDKRMSKEKKNLILNTALDFNVFLMNNKVLNSKVPFEI